MRIPTKRVYRAFPELDRYSDEQCRLFVRRLRKKPAYDAAVFVGTAAVLVTAIISLITFFVTCVGSGMLRSMLLESSVRPWLHRTLGRDGTDMLFLSCLVVLGVGVPALATLGARDFLYRHFLRRTIRMEIERIRCMHCGYSLLGQRVVDGSVRCPECGHRARLNELGLKSADDLMPASGVSQKFVDISARHRRRWQGAVTMAYSWYSEERQRSQRRRGPARW